MHLLLFGATGMVGIEVLHLALADPRISSVVTIGRRATGVTHPKLREVVHANMMALGPVTEELRHTDLIIHCLGVYTGAVPDDEFWTITAGYIEHLLAELKRLGADPAFCLMGAQGADPTERRRMIFARAKGRAERFLTESHLTRKHIFRPGYIRPGRGTSRATVPEWISQPIFALFPFVGIEASKLAAVMLEVGIAGSPQILFTNGDMRRFPTPR